MFSFQLIEDFKRTFMNFTLVSPPDTQKKAKKKNQELVYSVSCGGSNWTHLDRSIQGGHEDILGE